MKKSKLAIDAFASDSINRNQSLTVVGGIGGTGTGELPPGTTPFPGGPGGQGGTGSGPVNPNPLPPPPTA